MAKFKQKRLRDIGQKRMSRKKYAELQSTKKKYKVGDIVNYNVVTDTDYYQTEGEIIKINKDGTFNVKTAVGIDKMVDKSMIEHSEKYPAGRITIYPKK